MNNPKHPLLVLTSTYPRWLNDIEPGFVHLLCRQLTNTHRPVVLAPHFPGASRHEILDGIEVYRFRYAPAFLEHLAYEGGIMTNLGNNPLKLLLVPGFLLSQLYWIRRLGRQYDTHLIHAHWTIPQGLLAILARKLGCTRARILCTSHGGDLYSMKGGVMQRLKKLVFRHADHITVVSSAMRAHLQDSGINMDRISVQSMGVDLVNTFTPVPARTRNIDLLFVGRLVEKKGVSTLLDALAILKDEFPTIKAHIVGDGPERPALTRQAERLRLGEHVRFCGAIPNHQLPSTYRSARIVVVPSVVAANGDQEGLGLVAVEALGCGCAVVASDLPALGDVVSNEQNGLIFRAGDPADLAGKLRTLLDDSALYDRIIDNGRQSVVERFDWQAVGQRYSELLNRLHPD